MAALDRAKWEQGRCVTPDGLEIATYDFGGSGPDLLLVHATGFCAAVLAPVARSLTSRYHCWGLDLRAHGRSDRPANGDFAWSGFAADVLATVDQLGLDRPLGFGHSCGGAAVILAEQQRPGSFAALYGFEPIIFPAQSGRRSESEVGLAEGGRRLAEGAQRRRGSFPSREAALANFSTKPPFGDLDPDVLAAYVEEGFEMVPISEGGDGLAIRLRCRRDDEAQIYANGGSHDAFAHLGAVRCQVTLACGRHTDSFGPHQLELQASRLPWASIEVIPEIGHFGPMQRPADVAASMSRAFEPLGDPASPR